MRHRYVAALIAAGTFFLVGAFIVTNRSAITPGPSQGGFEINGYEMLKGLDGVATHEHAQWVPIFENTQDIPSLAEQVRAAFTNRERPLKHGYLIRRHGLYTWGKDLDEARRQIEIFEFLFECVARRMTLSGNLK